METQKHHELITETVKKITGYMSLDCQVTISEETKGQEKAMLVSVSTPDNARFLIGKDGQNLRALEQIVRLVSLKATGQIQNLTVDVNDYRKSQALRVIELARAAVERVRNTQKAEALEPMTPYERRVVHVELAAHSQVMTESIGEEPQRRIVIKPL